VTLARFKKNASRDAGRGVADLLSQRKDASRTMTDLVNRAQLVKSTLTPQGPIYTTVKESLLTGA
jgi:2'-5' RNA ligase